MTIKKIPFGKQITKAGQTVFVDSRHCIYRSQDAGDSWQKANGAGLPLVAGGALTHGGPSVIEVSHDFQDNGRVYLARDYKFFASHDGGASWSSTALARGLPVGIAAACNGTVLALAGGGLFASTDGGASFSGRRQILARLRSKGSAMRKQRASSLRSQLAHHRQLCY